MGRSFSYWFFNDVCFLFIFEGDSSDVVKAKLKQWAQVVACSMLVSKRNNNSK